MFVFSVFHLLIVCSHWAKAKTTSLKNYLKPIYTKWKWKRKRKRLKNKRQTPKTFFAFAVVWCKLAFWCKWVLTLVLKLNIRMFVLIWYHVVFTSFWWKQNKKDVSYLKRKILHWENMFSLVCVSWLNFCFVNSICRFGSFSKWKWM